jgi:hypothetical protein
MFRAMESEGDGPAHEPAILHRRPGLSGGFLLVAGLGLFLACSAWRSPYDRDWTFGDWAANAALAGVGGIAVILAVTGAVFLIKATRRRP